MASLWLPYCATHNSGETTKVCVPGRVSVPSCMLGKFPHVVLQLFHLISTDSINFNWTLPGLLHPRK